MTIPEVFHTATRREIMLARALFQGDYLQHSVYLNMNQTAMAIHAEYMRRLEHELSDPDDNVLLNYVGPMSEKELANAMDTRVTPVPGYILVTPEFLRAMANIIERGDASPEFIDFLRETAEKTGTMLDGTSTALIKAEEKAR
jgi:hypothetical protein